MLWKRWACEYVAALRERHNCKGDGSPKTLWIGDVVILGGDESNRGKWPMDVVVHLFMVEMESCEKSNSLQGNLSFRYPSSPSTTRAIVRPSEANSEVIKFKPRTDRPLDRGKTLKLLLDCIQDAMRDEER